MRKRTSLAAASGAFAITAALSVATAGLAAASPVPAPATGASASTATVPMQPARAASGLLPSARAITNHPAAAAKTTPPVKNKPAVPAARASSGRVTPSGGVAPLLLPPTTTGTTTCDETPTGTPATVPPCDTPVTFTVSSGVLSITVPVPVSPATNISLGSGHAGDIIASALGTGAAGDVTVTDDRALLSASWTATVSSTAFVETPATTPAAPDILASDIYYYSGNYNTGTAIDSAGTTIAPGQYGTTTAAGPPTSVATSPATPGANNGAVALGGTSALPVMSLGGTGTGDVPAVGANQVTWHPMVAVDIPSTAVAGDYDGTITHSVA